MPQVHPTREKILDAAELLFAETSYDAVSIRQIAAAAEVQLSLVTYHIGNKEKLYYEVIERRVSVLSESRLDRLQAALDANGGEPLPLRRIVEAFIEPYVHHSLTGGPGWKAYARLVARMSANPHVTTAIVDLFDPPGRIFLREMQRSMPRASEAQVLWGFTFMVCVMAGTLAENGRIDGLSGGRVRSSDIGAACAEMIPFVTAGLQAVGSRS
ncbi:TetR/AcrR family transcriptional regulator [Marinibaculum pumilum]|uniref:TetR/AcrR family transcriptional regulator n=1 Tax=Marinibaculum pumilum TaxID=1766165 RepID=A0ABV7KZ79_9PROT